MSSDPPRSAQSIRHRLGNGLLPTYDHPVGAHFGRDGFFGGGADPVVFVRTDYLAVGVITPG